MNTAQAMSQDSLALQVTALDHLGLKNLESVFWNLPAAALYEHALRHHEAQLADGGALLLCNGHDSEEAVKHRYCVHDAPAGDQQGVLTQRLSEVQFEALFDRIRAYLVGRSVYVTDSLVAAQSTYEQPLRLITQDAWHGLFAKTMFASLADVDSTIASKASPLSIIHVPHFHIVPQRDAVHGKSIVVIHAGLRIALIVGSAHAGDIKNTAFALMEYELMDSDVLPLRAAAFVAEDGAAALLLGPEGSGKTTLVTDPERPWLADDALGWSQQHLFNFEAGCYARLKHLDQHDETLMHAASQSFASLLQHAALDMQTRRLCFDDCSDGGDRAEHARAAFPLSSMAGVVAPKLLSSPKHLVLLVSDAFGVLPAISRLTTAQLMYYFLLGYASHAPVDETDPLESGAILVEATFSPCCGMALMARDPAFYATALGAKVELDQVQCWLLNTGWSGGPAGIGERMSIGLTRTLLKAALNGNLDELKYQTHPVLGLQMPEQLDPMHTWHNQDDPHDYINAVEQLAEKFKTTFSPFAAQMPADVLKAGPS